MSKTGARSRRWPPKYKNHWGYSRNGVYRPGELYWRVSILGRLGSAYAPGSGQAARGQKGFGAAAPVLGGGTQHHLAQDDERLADTLAGLHFVVFAIPMLRRFVALMV
jgi:hypothetical protein